MEHRLVLLCGPSNVNAVLRDKRLNLLRIVSLPNSVLGTLVSKLRGLLLLLENNLRLSITGGIIHIRTLIVAGREDVVYGSHRVLLREMLLEKLWYRIFHALQVHQEGAIKGLLGLGVQILVLVEE